MMFLHVLSFFENAIRRYEFVATLLLTCTESVKFSCLQTNYFTLLSLHSALYRKVWGAASARDYAATLLGIPSHRSFRVGEDPNDSIQDL